MKGTNAMKKIISLLLCIIIVCTLLTGCNDNTTDDHIVLKQSDVELVLDKATLEGDAKHLTSVTPFNNKTGFVVYDKRIDGGETYASASYFGAYDMETKELIEVGEYKPWITASFENSMIMNDRFLYFWALFWGDENNPNGQLNLIRMDVQDKKLEVLESMDGLSSYPPYMSKLSENEFISVIVKQEAGDEINVTASTTKIVKHDVITGEVKTIMEEKFSYIDGEQNSNGTLLESVCGIDNNIYAVGKQRDEGVWHYYFYTFDNEGKLISRIEAPALEHTMKYVMADGFYVVGNYFTLIKSGSGSQALYKISDNQIDVVVTHDEKMSFPDMSNFYSSEKTPYIYYSANRYAHDSEYQNTTDKSPVYALNIETGEIKTIKVDIDKERPYLDYILVDENGNLVVNLLEEEFGDQVREYFISKETLQKVLE